MKKGLYWGYFSRAGRFEMAQGGTLFLDEIGDMPLNMQVKFFVSCKSAHLKEVGGNKTIEVDVRIIAATHKNLEKMISDATFRRLVLPLKCFPN